MAIEKVISVKVAGTNQIVQIKQAIDDTNQATKDLTDSTDVLNSAVTKQANTSVQASDKAVNATNKQKRSIDDLIKDQKELQNLSKNENVVKVAVDGLNDLQSVQTAIQNAKDRTVELRREQLELEKQYKRTNSASTKKQIDEIKIAIKEEAVSVQELTVARGNLAEAEEENFELVSKLDELTGGYIAKFPALNSGIKSAIVGMNGLKLAIASTGIGLLLVAFASLISYFKSSEAGQDKFARLMGIIGSVVGNLTDKLSDFGELIVWVFENPREAIESMGEALKKNIQTRIEGLLEIFPKLGEAISLVMKGEFSEAGKVAADALGKVVLGQENIVDKFGDMMDASKEWLKELKADADEAVRIAKLREDATVNDRELMVEQAKANRDIAELREKAVQKDIYGAKQREQFLLKASKIEDEIFAKLIKSAKLREEAIIAENKLSKSTTEALDAEAKAQADVIQLEADRSKAQRALQVQIQSARREEASRLKAIRDETARQVKEAKDKEIEDLKKQIATITQIEQTAIKAREDALAKTEQQKLDLEKQRNLKAIEDVKLTEEQKREAINAVNALYDLKQQQLDEAKAKEAEEKAIEAKYKQFEDYRTTEEQKLEILAEIDSLLLDSVYLTEKQRTEITDKQAKARLDIAKKEADGRLKLNTAIAQGMDALSNIMGKNTVIGKTLAVASSLINTYSAIAGQLNAFSGIPIPGYAIAQAIATGLVGLASVKDILSVKVPTTGGASDSGGGVATNAPAVNLVGSTDSNQIAETINSQTNQQQEIGDKPIRAYVVAKDIRDQDELERNAVNYSSL